MLVVGSGGGTMTGDLAFGDNILENLVIVMIYKYFMTVIILL